ncbi:MAG: imidazoleglycerol-phosphate dehydratase [Fervidobacterium sp.]|uniref:imidazoleglycerol-phosphate dehydratase n=1 Tax=Fervidobacterium sp. TaxID=1871331 RepID=UPI00404B4797
MRIDLSEAGVFVERITNEVEISMLLSANVGKLEGRTGVSFFDHMLKTFCHYSGLGLSIQKCESKDNIVHHLLEDFGIVLGTAFRSLFDYSKIKRFGEATIPMDDALVGCYLDVGGRAFFQKNFDFSNEKIEDMPTEAFDEFLLAFVNNAKITVHFYRFAGKNEHHTCEAMVKAFGIAISNALCISERKTTKGVID